MQFHLIFNNMFVFVGICFCFHPNYALKGLETILKSQSIAQVVEKILEYETSCWCSIFGSTYTLTKPYHYFRNVIININVLGLVYTFSSCHNIKSYKGHRNWQWVYISLMLCFKFSALYFWNIPADGTAMNDTQEYGIKT